MRPRAALIAIAFLGAAGTASAQGVPSRDPSPDTAPVSTEVAAGRPGGVAPTGSEAKSALTVTVSLDDILSDEPDHLLKHAHFGDRFWFSGQLNLIFQAHPGFLAPYSGPNSFKKEREEKLSEVATLYFGVRLLTYTEILCDAENAAGKGLSNALGLAGFTDLDVVRNPDLGAEAYLARLMLHQTIPLSDDMVPNPSLGPLSIRQEVPARRIEIRIGKLGMADFFDVNGPGSDSHFQLENWATCNCAAYDYAADTRGYTYAAIVEFQDPIFAVRYAEAVMPRAANGIDYDWRLNESHAENLELEVHGKPFADRSGAARLLLYDNHARMGSYRSSNRAFFAGVTPSPDITFTRRPHRTKYGIELNGEQEVLEWLRVFGRAGVNDGRNESFAYTECENSFELGLDVRGDEWGRERDRFGVAFASNGLLTEHRRYLANGGLGFLLGDGRLRYGRETIIDSYYTCRFPYGISLGPTFQHIWNPGYNRDRGPVAVFGLRFHLEL